MSEGRTTTYRHDGLTFEVLDRGPVDGPAVVLLHGFPQDATAFDEVARRLADAGVRTLAPRQRGYSPGARPRDVGSYRIGRLVDDVVALLDAAGLDRVHLVGHDWGAAVAWATAQLRPDRVATLTALSVPHPAALAWAARHNRDQLRRSWYVLAFQVPVLPQLLLARLVRGGGLDRMGLPDEHAQTYAAALGRADDLRGPVHWYRAALRPRLGGGGWHRLEDPGAVADDGARVRVPTTYVWGSRDPFLGRAGAERSAAHVDADYRFVEVDAGHWLPEKYPDVVVREVLARLGR